MNETRGCRDRGQNEIIGMVLLIGLVFTGSVTVVVLGAGVLSDAKEGASVETAEQDLRQLDARLASLAGSDVQDSVEFDASDTVASDYRLERAGYFNVTVNENASCSFERNLSTVVYEDSRGRTVGYEAGGIWRGNPNGGSTAVSAPDVTFDDGTLDVSLMNVTGTVNQLTNVIRVNATATRNTTAIVGDALRQGQCVRPDNLTVWVKSEYQRGWANYLTNELGIATSNVDTFSNGTVRAYVPQSALHPSADDRTNLVVDMRHDPPSNDVPYMENVTLEGRLISDGPVTVNVSKDAGNTYSAFIEPLTEKGLDIGQHIDIDSTNIPGPPIDAVIILDESGSMRFDANGGGDCGWNSFIGYYDWCPDPKLDAAIDAGQRFIGSLNESRDRVGIVGYNSSAYYHRSDGRYLTRDHDAANDTLENDVTAFGGTRIDYGIDNSTALFDFKGNESRSKYAIMLTDGENDCASSPCDANSMTEQRAAEAAERDITIYTVGYGGSSDLNETLLKIVANETGGKYYQATDSDELAEVFEDIGRQIKPQNAIASTPITSNITAGSNLFDADIPGDTSHIARVGAGANSLLNVNDPTAPTLFSHSFPHADDEDFDINITSYDCKPDSWELTGQTRVVNGSTVNVARCTDMGSLNRTYGANVYVDGDRPEALLRTKYASWQDDVNTSLDRFPGVEIDQSTGVLQAQSNQALIVFDLPPVSPTDSTRNTLALLLQVGLSDTEAAGEEIVSVRVTEADVAS